MAKTDEIIYGISNMDEQRGIEGVQFNEEGETDNYDGFFIDEFDDLEDSSVLPYTLVNLDAAYEEDQESLMGLTKAIFNMLRRIDVDKIMYLVDILEGNIALVKQQELVKSGKTAPAKKDVSDTDLRAGYLNGMSCREIAMRYDMTEDGIRKRLKKLGVFKNKTNYN